MTDVAAFQALLDKKTELEKTIRAEAREVFAAQSKAIFEKYPDTVGLFGWQQYTPYFNDGELCEFGVHELFIYTPQEVKEHEENGDLEHGEFSYWETAGQFSEDETIYKHKETGKTTTWIPYDYDKREYAEDEYEKIPNPRFNPDCVSAEEEVRALFNLLDEDTSLALFGDHACVLVTPDGVEVEEASHD